MVSSAPPRSFVADAVDLAAVEEARAARRRLATVRRVVGVALPLLCAAGLFALIMMPCFVRFPCRSRQSEAKGNLKALVTTMAAWVDEHGRASDRVAEIGFSPRGSRPRYRYVVTDVDGASFRAWAFGATAPVDGDVWVIDQDHRLENLVNRCEGVR